MPLPFADAFEPILSMRRYCRAISRTSVRNSSLINKHVGKRKLTKHGDGEYRRLLHCAAMTAVRHQPYFKARYAELLAFQLLSKDLEFDPNRLGASQRT